MTIQTRISATELDQLWETAAFSANAWRGQAIQIFAQAEVAVSDTLEALAAVPGRGGEVRLRRLVGQRFEDLAYALCGAFAQEGVKAGAALAQFRTHEELRPFLCHAVAKLTLDRKVKWVLILKLVAFQARGTQRTSLTIEQNDAAMVLANLREDGRRLGSAMQSLRSRLQS
jgi:hypothetical protein